MKRLLVVLSILTIFCFGGSIISVAQKNTVATNEIATKNSTPDSSQFINEPQATLPNEGGSAHNSLKQKFIEGGAGWMAPIALCLIIGLALCIERIIYLSLSATNTKKLLSKIESEWNRDGVTAAMEVCRNTRGPVASIFYQGLSRIDEGIDVVEKSVASYGSVQLGLMEKNLSWITLFIALSPSLGFLGTVVGMIQAFDKIQQVGDISATVVASGIKVALLTTVFGLIVAMILQVFFNYILSMVEGLTNDMEDASISLLDIIVKNSKQKFETK